MLGFKRKKRTEAEAQAEEPALADGDAKFSDDVAVSDTNGRLDGTETPSEEAASVSGAAVNEQDTTPAFAFRHSLFDADVAEVRSISIKTSAVHVQTEVHPLNRIEVMALSDDPFETEQFRVLVRQKSISIGFLHSHLRGMFRRSASKVFLRVRVPEHFALSVATREGHIKVTGIEGNLNLRSNSGDIELDCQSGKLSVETNSGSVRGVCRCAHVQVESRRGDVDLRGLSRHLKARIRGGTARFQWDSTPTDAKVQVRTAKQPLTLTLPAETRLNYRFITGATGILNEFKQHEDSNVRLRIISKKGQINLEKAVS